MRERTTLAVVQHTAAEYLGLIEDHLEGRGIQFRYFRPFTAGGRTPTVDELGDGLILLGGGPWGSAGPHNLPSLVAEVELAAHCLKAGIALLGFGLGAQILALAGGGKTHPRDLRFVAAPVQRCDESALNGYLPAQFALVDYGRDWFTPPPAARVLARSDDGEVAVFQLGGNALGFAGHPGFKAAIAEDLIMEADAVPPGGRDTLLAVRSNARLIEDKLVPIMTGIVQVNQWMEPRPEA